MKIETMQPAKSFLVCRMCPTAYYPRMILMIGLILGMILPMRSSAQVNFYYYENFDITGPTSVCVDGTTVHNYSGPIEGLTWSITGGEFVGANTGMSVSIKWNSESMSISATGVESDCYYDPEIYPPVLYCDITTYTSNSFSLSPSIVAGYGLSASPYYMGTSGATVTLSGSQIGVTYQLKINGTPAGAPVPGTGSSLAWSNQTANGPYTVTATKASPACSILLASSVTITMQGPLVSPSNPPAISYGESVNLSISGTYYSIQWLKSGMAIAEANQLQYTVFEPGQYSVQVKETAGGPLLTSSTVNVPTVAVPANYSQSKLVDDVTLTTNDGTKTYLILTRVILSPGAQTLVFSGSSGPFTFKMVSDKNRKVPPSMDQNFVRTETVLTSGIKLEPAMQSLTESQVSVNYAYADGAGRSSQSITAKSSPGKGDMVQPFTYPLDNGYRIDKEYLPYTVASQQGAFRIDPLVDPDGPSVSEHDNFYNTSPKVKHDDSRRHSEFFYEKSMLNRMTEAYGPGEAWSDNSKRTKSIVTAAGVGLPQWKINAANGLPYSAGNYPVSVLSSHLYPTKTAMLR